MKALILILFLAVSGTAFAQVEACDTKELARFCSRVYVDADNVLIGDWLNLEACNKQKVSNYYIVESQRVTSDIVNTFCRDLKNLNER